MIRYCHRCGCEIERHKDQKVLEFSGKNGQEFRVLCPTCNKMTLAFCTPAYIPELSKTEWDIIVHQKEKCRDVSIFDQFRNEIKNMRERGLLVHEIAQAAGVSNRTILEVLKC